MLTVKRGDRYDIFFTVYDDDHNVVDLSGADVRLLARTAAARAPIVLPHTIPNPTIGKIVHRLDGTLKVGGYRVEAELTRGDEIKTAPTTTYENLRVIADLG